MPFRLYPRLTFDISSSDLLSAAIGSGRNPTIFLNPREWVPALSVRTLFDALLTELNLPHGTTILFTAINIAGMVEIARHHGLNVEVVDIDPDTLLPPDGALVSAAERKSAKLCVIAQLFGARSRVNDIPALQEMGVLVISDLAQAYASIEDLDERDNADVRLFSFGAIKRKTALGGALGLFASTDLADAVMKRVASYPRRSDLWFRQRAFKYLTLKALSHPILYALLESLFRLLKMDFDIAIGNAARGFGQDTDPRKYQWKPPLRLTSLMIKRVAEEPDKNREAAAWEFIRSLPDGVFVPGARADVHHHWLVPVCLPDPDAVMLDLRKNGYDATRGATSLYCIDEKSAPAAANLMKTVLYLPHPVHLSRDERSRMAGCLASAVTP